MVVKYYRLYLWVYLASFVILFLIAITLDTFYSISSQSIKYPKLISVFISCIFSIFSIFLFHKFIAKKLNLQLHKDDKKKWNNVFIKYSAFDKKKAKFSKKFNIFWINLIVNFINIFPVFLFGMLYAVKVISLESNFFSFLFMSLATLFRYISWYITFFLFSGFLFLNRNKKLSYLSQ